MNESIERLKAKYNTIFDTLQKIAHMDIKKNRGSLQRSLARAAIGFIETQDDELNKSVNKIHAIIEKHLSGLSKEERTRRTIKAEKRINRALLEKARK